MARAKSYLAIVSLPEAHSLPMSELHGIMDMMRYDQAMVISAHHDCFVIKTPGPVTVDRWKSFGLVVITRREPVQDGEEYGVISTMVDGYRVGRQMARERVNARE